MLILGPVGGGSRREQALACLAHLDSAELEWWRVESLHKSVKIARAVLEAGEQPPRLLEQTIDNGMRRLARRVSYVLWGPGPWDARPEKQVAGFWPKKGALMRALKVGGIRRMDEYKEPTIYQRYWLRVRPGEYSLHGLSKKGIWIMHGRWTTVHDVWQADIPERWR